MKKYSRNLRSQHKNIDIFLCRLMLHSFRHLNTTCADKKRALFSVKCLINLHRHLFYCDVKSKITQNWTAQCIFFKLRAIPFKKVGRGEAGKKIGGGGGVSDFEIGGRGGLGRRFRIGGRGSLHGGRGGC